MKSSIEQLAIALYEKGYLQGNGDEINDLLERHKAMHKKEIMQAWKMGDGKFDNVAKDMSCDYYNETYGGDK